MRARFLKRVRTPAGVSFLALALLLGGGMSLVILDDETPLTRLTSATSTEELAAAEALVQVTPEPVVTQQDSIAERVRPVLHCVDRHDDEWIAYFGYQNDNGADVEVPVGDENHLAPDPLDGSQPSTFDAGASPYLFAVALEPGSTVGWSLQGRTATATEASPECETGAYGDLALPTPS